MFFMMQYYMYEQADIHEKEIQQMHGMIVLKNHKNFYKFTSYFQGILRQINLTNLSIDRFITECQTHFLNIYSTFEHSLRYSSAQYFVYFLKT